MGVGARQPGARRGSAARCRARASAAAGPRARPQPSPSHRMMSFSSLQSKPWQRAQNISVSSMPPPASATASTSMRSSRSAASWMAFMQSRIRSCAAGAGAFRRLRAGSGARGSCCARRLVAGAAPWPAGCAREPAPAPSRGAASRRCAWRRGISGRDEAKIGRRLWRRFERGAVHGAPLSLPASIVCVDERLLHADAGQESPDTVRMHRVLRADRRSVAMESRSSSALKDCRRA